MSTFRELFDESERDEILTAMNVEGLPKAQRDGPCWVGFWQAGVLGRRSQNFKRPWAAL